MKKRITLWLLTLFFWQCFACRRAAGRENPPHSSWTLALLPVARLLEAFRQELSKLGWIEGKNIIIEYRFAEQKRERLPELARTWFVLRSI